MTGTRQESGIALRKADPHEDGLDDGRAGSRLARAWRSKDAGRRRLADKMARMS